MTAINLEKFSISVDQLQSCADVRLGQNSYVLFVFQDFCRHRLFEAVIL